MGWVGSCRGGVGHAGVEWVMSGWYGSYRGGLGWVMQGWVGETGGVGHAGGQWWIMQGWVMQGCSGSYRGRVRGHTGVGWVM